MSNLLSYTLKDQFVELELHEAGHLIFIIVCRYYGSNYTCYIGHYTKKYVKSGDCFVIIQDRLTGDNRILFKTRSISTVRKYYYELIQFVVDGTLTFKRKKYGD